MKRMKSMGTQELLELYIRSAQGYIDEIREGTARAANRHNSVANRIIEELKHRGENREILMLLSHPRPAVRLWAAIDALGMEPDSAQRVLEALVENAIPIIKVYASRALDSFHKGNLPNA